MRTIFILVMGILTFLKVSAQNSGIYDPFVTTSSIGFDVIYLKDHSRPLSQKSFREIQVALWYPLDSTEGQNVELADYFQLYLSEEGHNILSEEEIENNKEFWVDQLQRFEIGLDPKTLLKVKMLPTKQSIAKLKPKDKFPLIIYAAGGQGESFENALLCEYLASKGFVVAAIPSVGTDNHEMNTDIRGLDSQISDMELVINGLSGYEFIDLQNIGLMGWSWGGLAAMGLQSQNKNVKAVASLDGSIAGYWHVIDKLPGYDINTLNVPFLFLATDESTIKRVTDYFDKLKYSDASLISFSKIDHGDFNNYAYIAHALSGQTTVNTKFYTVMMEIISRFFQKNLQGSDMDSLKNYIAENGEVVSKYREKQGLPSPPSEAEFIEMITNDGIKKSLKKYNILKERDSSYKPFRPFELTKLAFRFARDSIKKDQAIPVMDLVLMEYPNSYSTYALKGRILELLNQPAEALLNFGIAYGLALELAPIKPGEEKVFYEDIVWYEEKILKLKEQLN